MFSVRKAPFPEWRKHRHMKRVFRNILSEIIGKGSGFRLTRRALQLLIVAENCRVPVPLSVDSLPPTGSGDTRSEVQEEARAKAVGLQQQRLKTSVALQQTKITPRNLRLLFEESPFSGDLFDEFRAKLQALPEAIRCFTVGFTMVSLEL